MNISTIFLFLCSISYILATYTDSCPDGVDIVNCLVDPCNVTKCEAHPEAECRANYCGGCNAEFYVKGERVSCDLCPDGVDIYNCLVNPCEVTKCEAHPNAECRANYCGGCNAEFYVNGYPVCCTPCPDGVSLVNCYSNPCEVTKCERYPDAVCKANFCGGCNAEFYVNNKRVYCGELETANFDFYGGYY